MTVRVLITGADGFIGKNLRVRLAELRYFDVETFTRDDDISTLVERVERADAIIHLAGENRPSDTSKFMDTNFGLTKSLCEIASASHRKIAFLLASSTQAEMDNPYGLSKLAAEKAVEEYSLATGNPAAIYRLPGVFGKWCKPHYNSVVATFCHNIARDLPISVSDPKTELKLVYVDDVALEFMSWLAQPGSGVSRPEVNPAYTVSLGNLEAKIRSFAQSRENLITEQVGVGFSRALYSTFVSYLPIEKFSYKIPMHGDPRGNFVEMLKTHDSGQFSYFTAHPGVTRGGHYHHSKTEKFLVISGRARFAFRHLITGERFEFEVDGNIAQIVDTVPGWTHDITNIGETELIVMLWANEVFDLASPDTYACPV